MIEDPERDRHYLNAGRIASVFAGCEDHAAYLLYAICHTALPARFEHLPLAAVSWRLREDLAEAGLPNVAAQLRKFSERRNQLAHSVLRSEWVETEPDADGFKAIIGSTNHTLIHPRTGKESPLPSDAEIEEFADTMKWWCRDRRDQAVSISRGGPVIDVRGNDRDADGG